MDTDPQFVRQLREVLNHLYDFAYLQNHSLLDWFGESHHYGPSRSQATRRIVLEAIEQMNPGPRFSPRAPESRCYQILLQRFLEGRPPSEVAQELGIVERQFYRDQHEAIHGLASLLWEHHSETLAPNKADSAQGAILTEVMRFDDRGGRTSWDICELVREALQLAQSMHTKLGGDVHLVCPDGPLMLSTSRMLLRQAVLQILGSLYSFDGLQSLQATVCLLDDHPQIVFQIHAEPMDGYIAHLTPDIAAAQQVLQPISASITHETLAKERARLSIDLPADRPIVLVIEDNRDAVQLFERFLSDRSCRVLGVGSGREGLDLAQQLQPAAIILDLMIPVEDGWEILQRLKANPTTEHIPVIVCSVLHQEPLARALGASGYLRKPVTREMLLSELDRLLQG